MSERFLDWGHSSFVTHDKWMHDGPVEVTHYWLRIGAHTIEIERERPVEEYP